MRTRVVRGVWDRRLGMQGQERRGRVRSERVSLKSFGESCTGIMLMGVGRRIMQGLAGQLGIIDGTLQSAVQIFKLAAMNNFIQGRRMDMVCAVCLYSACRKEKPCRVMLIDFADKVQVCQVTAREFSR